MNVELSAEARAQVLEVDAWWRENRRSAPDLFVEELAETLLVLEAKPMLGAPYRVRDKESVRRVLLRRSHHHLYFVEESDRLYVLAVWSAYRGREPKL